MKKIIILFIFLLFLLFGCGNKSYEIHNDIENPYPETEAVTGRTYIVNMLTKAYHLPSCTYAKNMKIENREETKDISALREKGYKPCLVCIKK